MDGPEIKSIRIGDVALPYLSYDGGGEPVKSLGEIRQALRSLLDDQPFGELHYPDKSERILTRLGRPTFELPLAAPLRSPFGVTIDRVALPAHWLKGDSLPETLEAEASPEGLRFRIGASAFRYTRLGLEKDDA